MRLSIEQLREALVIPGIITEEELQSAANRRESQQVGIGEVLINRGVISDEEFGQMIALWYNVPFTLLSRREIRADVVSLIPEVFAREHLLLLLSVKDTIAEVATSDPSNIEVRTLLEKALRKTVRFSYATQRDIKKHFVLYQVDPSDVFKVILERKAAGPEGMDTRAKDAVDEMLNIAYQRHVSDVHLDPEDDFFVLRFREDGILHDVFQFPIELQEKMITRIKVMARLAIDEHRKAQDGKISYTTVWGSKLEIRVSIVPTTHQEKVVMRLLTDQAQALSLPELGLVSEDYEKVVDAAQKPWGMILVTGPTGSGKTTTMYAVLQLLNQRDVNITTIEDPVEIDIEGVAQIQVSEKSGLTFAKGLRSIVRQDPDIIMVGEIRDPETAGIAVNAAMTGHLVLSSLHTNDSATAFVRLVDFGIEEFLITSTVNLVVGQRLVRKVCMSCIVSTTPNKEQIALLEHAPEVKKLLLAISQKASIEDLRFYQGKGCKVCHMSGYHGRMGIFEVLPVSETINQAIMDNKNSEDIAAIARSEGMVPMVQDGLRKVLLGQTTIEEVLRVSQLEL